MEFARDRDLAVLEPSLYRDVSWQTQTLVAGFGNVVETTLELVSSDVDFAASQLQAGMIAVINSVAYEITAYVDYNLLAVSKLRVAAGEPAIPLATANNQPFVVRTLRPQIVWAHAQFMAMAGLLAGEENKIMNKADAMRLEAIGALALVYSAAGAMEPAAGVRASRAAFYRKRFAEERGRTVLLLDHDGDGRVDEQRLLHVGRMMR